MFILMTMSIGKKGEEVSKVFVNSDEMSIAVARDILERLKSSNSLFLHNSTEDHNEYYVRGGKRPYSMTYRFREKTDD